MDRLRIPLYHLLALLSLAGCTTKPPSLTIKIAPVRTAYVAGEPVLTDLEVTNVSDSDVLVEDVASGYAPCQFRFKSSSGTFVGRGIPLELVHPYRRPSSRLPLRPGQTVRGQFAANFQDGKLDYDLKPGEYVYRCEYWEPRPPPKEASSLIGPLAQMGLIDPRRFDPLKIESNPAQVTITQVRSTR